MPMSHLTSRLEDGREIARQCLRAAAQYKEMSSDEIQGLRVSSAEFVNGVVKPLAGSVGNLEERDEVKAGQIGRLLVRMQDLEKRLPPRPTRHPWPSWIIRLIAVVIAAVLVALTWDLIWEHIEIQHLRAEVADHRRVILDFIQYFKEHGAP